MRPACCLGGGAPAPEVVGPDRAGDRAAGVLRHHGALQRYVRQRFGGVEPRDRAVRDAQRVDRDRAAGRQRHRLRALRAEAAGRAAAPRGRRHKRGLLHNNSLTRCGFLTAHCPDRRPRGLLELQLTSLDQPAPDRSVRLVVGAGVGDPHEPAGLPSALVDLGVAPNPGSAGSARRAGRRPRPARGPSSTAARPASESICCARPVGPARRQVGRRRVQRKSGNCGAAPATLRPAARSSR